MNYQIDQTHSITILFASKVNDCETFNKQIALNKDIIYAAINPEYLVTLKAALIALYKIISCKQLDKYTSMEFQKDLCYLLMPEENKIDNRFIINNFNKPSLHFFIKGYQEEFGKLFDQDHLNNLYLCCNLPQIINYYQVSQQEIQLDGDFRGAIYNQIVMKKLRK